MREPQSFQHRGVLIQGPYTPESCEATLNMRTKPDDIYLVTYPRTGTTWTQNIMMAVRFGVPQDGLCQDTIWEDLNESFPYLEIVRDEVFGVDKAAKLECPRYLKTHFPKDLSPSGIFEHKRKCILVLRSLKDSCVSNFHFYNNMLTLRPFASKTFDEFCGRYVRGDVTYGSQWDFNQGWLQYASHNPDTVLVIHYEDLKSNFSSEVRKLSAFMGYPHISGEQIRDIEAHCSVGSMKERHNKTEDNFVRQGKSKSWVGMMSEETVKLFDKTTEDYFGKNPVLKSKLL